MLRPSWQNSVSWLGLDFSLTQSGSKKRPNHVDYFEGTSRVRSENWKHEHVLLFY